MGIWVINPHDLHISSTQQGTRTDASTDAQREPEDLSLLKPRSPTATGPVRAAIVWVFTLPSYVKRFDITYNMTMVALRSPSKEVVRRVRKVCVCRDVGYAVWVRCLGVLLFFVLRGGCSDVFLVDD